jgi:WD40 repeat protein
MQIAKEVPHAHDANITCTAFDQAHGIVYVGAEHPDIRAWSLRSAGEGPSATLKAHKGHVTSLAFCEGLNVLISGGIDGLCILWDDRFKVLQARSATSAMCGHAERSCLLN